MNNFAILRVGMVLMGLIIVGEALALLVGMHLLSERGNSWVSFKNDILVGVDIVTGIGLIGLAVVGKGMNPFYVVLTLALVAHGYRTWEYGAAVVDKFCINMPLFVFNNVKFLGLLIVAGIATILRISHF